MPPGDEPSDRVKATDHGEGRGVSVHIPREHLRRMGVDPDAALEVNRTVFDGSDRAEMRLRFYEADDE